MKTSIAVIERMQPAKSDLGQDNKAKQQGETPLEISLLQHLNLVSSSLKKDWETIKVAIQKSS